MNSDLLECKRKAKEKAKSENPPRNLNARKIGYMNIMKELWEDADYASLSLSCQNLRDQASRLENTIGNVRDTILRNVNRENEEPQSESIKDIGTGNEEAQTIVVNNIQSIDSDLHNTSCSPVPEEQTSQLNTDVNKLLQLASPILDSVIQSPGDFTDRRYDTRTKQRPTKAHIENVSTAVKESMKSNCLH